MPIRCATLLACSLLFACGVDEDPDGDGDRADGGTTIPDAGSEPDAGPLGVQRYDYAFDLTTAEARSIVTLRADPSEDCVHLRSRPEARALTLEDAPAATVSQTDGTMSICGSLPEHPFRLTSTVTVPRDQMRPLQVGYSQSLNLADGLFSYLLGWVGECDRFGPCDPAADQLTHFRFEVTHRAGEVVLCPGRRTAEATRTVCELLETPAPTYSSFAIAADSGWLRTPIVTAAGVSVELYETLFGNVATRLDPDVIGGYLEWITSLLGPFPYGDTLRLATGPTAWFGMEHPANVVLHEGLDLFDGEPYPNTAQHVLFHEIAHQWAGDRTTLASPLDFAWKESIAEYLSYVYEDEHLSNGEALATRTYWHDSGLFSGYPVRPRADPGVALKEWYGAAYGAGPMVFFLQLEPLLGRDALLEGIAVFLSESRARSADDLRAALEEASRRDLAPWFDAWIFGDGRPEWPTFSARATVTDGGVSVTLTQRHSTNRIFPCVVDVDVVGASKTARARFDFGLAPETASQTVTIAFDEPVTGLAIDPDDRILNRISNALTRQPPVLPWHP